MATNRSVPADLLLPHISYPDLPEAIAWLSRAFGFREHYRYGEPAAGAMVHQWNCNRISSGESCW
ncbi:MAG: hypothetical protein ABSH49_11055 [Bryobacteraceae bacterium]|jgi:uncharacterized glyoxalase superfamily protein PhnB